MAFTLGLAALLALASCTNRTDTASMSQEQTEATPTVATETGAPPALSVSQIELGRNVDVDQRITERMTEFAPGEPVYASVITNGVAEGAEVRVRWTDVQGQLVDESVQTISTQGPSAIGFRMTKPGLTPGSYRVEVFVNGQPAGTQDFTIRNVKGA